MEKLQVTARLTIHEGKLEAFKALAGQCMQLVRDRDSGTLQYDWFLSDDQTHCVIRETYRDSRAALEHIANLGPTLAAIFGVSDLTLEVYGSPSDELVAATAGLSPKIYAPFQSLQ